MKPQRHDLLQLEANATPTLHNCSCGYGYTVCNQKYVHTTTNVTWTRKSPAVTCHLLQRQGTTRSHQSQTSQDTVIPGPPI